MFTALYEKVPLTGKQDTFICIMYNTALLKSVSFYKYYLLFLSLLYLLFLSSLGGEEAKHCGSECSWSVQFSMWSLSALLLLSSLSLSAPILSADGLYLGHEIANQISKL